LSALNLPFGYYLALGNMIMTPRRAYR